VLFGHSLLLDYYKLKIFTMENELKELELDIIANALTAYGNEFAKSIRELEKNGKNSILGEETGHTMARDIRIKLGIDLKKDYKGLFHIEKLK